MSHGETPSPPPNALLDLTTGPVKEGGALLHGKCNVLTVNNQCVHLIVTVPTVHCTSQRQVNEIIGLTGVFWVRLKVKTIPLIYWAKARANVKLDIPRVKSNKHLKL